MSHHIFFFKYTATTEIYTLSLHDALPISRARVSRPFGSNASAIHDPSSGRAERRSSALKPGSRSEEHTSELQSQSNLVCRLLLEKKKTFDVQTVRSMVLHTNDNIICTVID